MKPSEALAAARPLIESGEYNYICKALGSLNDSGAFHAIAYIDALLGISLSYETWLIREHGINPFDDRDRLRISRLAWIDDMIAYWRAKGE